MIKNIKKHLIIFNLILFSSLSFAQTTANTATTIEQIDALNQKIQTLENDKTILQNSILNIEKNLNEQKRIQDSNNEQINKKIEEADQKIKEDKGTLTTNINYTWILICAALVFFMQAGFALIESGASRSKNIVNVLMKNYMDMTVGAIAFALIGYGLMFGTNLNGFIGLSHFGLQNFTNNDYMFFFFQLMFAATAATIVSGALAERTSLQATLLEQFSFVLSYTLFLGVGLGEATMKVQDGLNKWDS